MEKKLNEKDLDFILESLKYTKLRFEKYDKYPSNEFKQERINDANEIIAKVQFLKQNLKEI